VLRVTHDESITPLLHGRLADRISARIDAPRGLCAELIRQKGRYLMHLVNYGRDAVRSVSVRMRVPDGAAISAVRLVSPAQPRETDVQFVVSGQHVHFSVSDIDVYAIVLLDLKPHPH
jgi:hypothetical protein